MHELSATALSDDTAGRPAPRRSASGPPSEEARAFLQRRVAAFGKILAIVFGLFVFWRGGATVVTAFEEPPHEEAAPLPFLLLAFTAFLALWLLCRGRPRSATVVRGLEAGALIVGCSAVGLMGFTFPFIIRPDYILLQVLTYILVLRAVCVPSSARETIAVAALIGVPLLVTLYFVHREGHNPAHYTAVADDTAHQAAPTWAADWVIVGGIWWIATTAIAAATSHVIYGLRREVRDARRLGQYTLLEKLGEGGMGVVYRASHAMLRRPAAIKLLPPEKLGDQSLARFEREVQQTALLTHQNTVRVFDFGRTPDGIFYYAMELVDGGNLAQAVAIAGPLPPGRVIHILDQVAGALAEAHGIGLIHRDIKPANILLTEQGGVADVVKVVDFGLVKRVGSGAAAEPAAPPSLSHVGAFAGTPQYMAPEAIAQPETVDARTDLYALGAVGYLLLTGHDVFTGNNVMEICGHHLHSAPVPPSQRLGRPVPADLEALILACLDKVPERRPASARELQLALRGLAHDDPWNEEEARRWWAAHGDALRGTATRRLAGSATTLAVDLELRAASD